MLKKLLILGIIAALTPAVFAASPKENTEMSELYQITENFINNDVPTVGKLDKKMRELITIVVLTSNGQSEYVKDHVEKALKAGAKPVEIREAIYQCAPYVGVPKALDAEKAMMERLKQCRRCIRKMNSTFRNSLQNIVSATFIQEKAWI